jgi:hypothetical protein
LTSKAFREQYVTFKHRWLVCALCCALFRAVPGAAQSVPKVGGYIQARETYQSPIGLTATLNRARSSVDGSLPGGFSYRLLVEYEANGTATTAASVSLRDAYIRWQLDPLSVTAGQFKAPFSREYITSITAIETADRATVVDSLAPKRDIGLMADLALGATGALSLGVFNGDGQNRPSNRDSSVLVVARATVRPLSQVTLGADVARYNADSVRYGAEASIDYQGLTLRGEYIEQHRATKQPMDWGWFGLAAFRVVPWLQLVIKQEEFERPAITASQSTTATTAGVNADLSGGRVRWISEYVSRRWGSPGARTGVLVTQLQVRF